MTHHKSGQYPLKEYVKFGLVILFILVASLITARWDGGGFQTWMKWFMSIFFIVFS